MNKDHKSRPQEWSQIHNQDVSWRKQLIGDINDVFVVPRYVSLFYEFFGNVRDFSFFEIGSGNGDLCTAILENNHGQIQRYVTSECFPEGVNWLERQGLECILADAMELPVHDQEYDAAVEFDVLHHVECPRDMVLEMMRIARGQCLLVESNGLSIFRRLKELTPGHRAAGERSYTPREYRMFFEGHAGYTVTKFIIAPFLFPFKCPKWFLPALVAFNRAIEKVPLVRWQCSSVHIFVEYRCDRVSHGLA